MCEIAEVFNNATPIARKEHRCCECRGIIKKGEKYHYITGLWCGEWHTFKVCLDCENMRSDINANRHYDECVPFTSLLEDLIEEIKENKEGAFFEIVREYIRKIETRQSPSVHINLIKATLKFTAVMYG